LFEVPTFSNQIPPRQVIPSLVKVRVHRAMGPTALITKLDPRDARKQVCEECGKWKVPSYRIKKREEILYFCKTECLEVYFPDSIDPDTETISEWRAEFLGPTADFTSGFWAMFGWLNRSRGFEDH